jgi:hypothetical protein
MITESSHFCGARRSRPALVGSSQALPVVKRKFIDNRCCRTSVSLLYR